MSGNLERLEEAEKYAESLDLNLVAATFQIALRTREDLWARKIVNRVY